MFHDYFVKSYTGLGGNAGTGGYSQRSMCQRRKFLSAGEVIEFSHVCTSHGRLWIMFSLLASESFSFVLRMGKTPQI